MSHFHKVVLFEFLPQKLHLWISNIWSKSSYDLKKIPRCLVFKNETFCAIFKHYEETKKCVITLQKVGVNEKCIRNLNIAQSRFQNFFSLSLSVMKPFSKKRNGQANIRGQLFFSLSKQNFAYFTVAVVKYFELNL